MDKNRKISFIVVPIVAAVLIAGVLIYYFVFYLKDDNNTEDPSIDYNNPAVIAELNNNQNNIPKSDEIIKGELVDEKINNELTAKIQQSVNSLGNVAVDSIKIYKLSGTPDNNSLNQDTTGNSQVNQAINQSGNTATNTGDNAGGNQANIQNNQAQNTSTAPESVNVIMDLTLTPSSNSMETARQEMETQANNLAVSIATEKPTIMTAIVNFSMKNNPNAKASFTFERSGNNMFLQEFTMSSEFN